MSFSMSHAATEFQLDQAALDPRLHPELYDGVRSARVMAFLIDAGIIFALMLIASMVIAVLGVFTLGLGWLLFPLVWPLVAVLYEVLTIGGPASATPGMRLLGIELRTVEGVRMDYPFALMHSLGFWFTVTLLTPFVLLIGLFTPRKQLLHDLFLGTVVIRSRR